MGETTLYTDLKITGTTTGITKGMVGLGSVDNTSDLGKPISTLTQAALDLKANALNPAFSGTATGLTKGMVGLGSVDNTSDLGKPISTLTQTALDLKANTNNPQFTGTATGLTAASVGLGNVNNTSDLGKPISTLTQTALNLKADISNPNFTGKITVEGVIDSTITGSGKTFANADNGKIFHISGNNVVVLPAWSSLSVGWTIGIVNVSGNTITVNITGSDLVNGVGSVINTSIYTGFYVYKSDVTNQFIAIGTVY